MGKSSSSDIVDHHHFERLRGDPRQSKIIVAPVVDQIVRMEAGAGESRPARSGREWSRDKLMKIGTAITIRIVTIRLYGMNIARNEHDILDLVAKNRIDNHLAFPLESGSVRPTGPTIVSAPGYSASLWN